MSETIIPEETVQVASDVEEKAGESAEQTLNLADKSLSEISEIFQNLKQSADAMLRSKEADAIKSAFYKLLIKLKGESDQGGEEAVDVETETRNNPFEIVEENFKAMYADYKKERAEVNRRQEAEREENLAKKQAVIEELKALVEQNSESVNVSFPAFRELQDRWRNAGPVPATSYRDINDTYQFYVEKFYDIVKIDRDLRDLDFRKNLEAKEAFCEAAENENVVEAFRELQKLHEQWKEFGPVAKEKREDIWNRFKAATAVINKRYQAYFEGRKEEEAANLASKTALCEKMEAIAATEVQSSGEWNELSKQIEELQAEWRKIGFATKKENQKVYERFRAACDAFFERKRNFYNEFKDSMNENYDKKMELVREAEELKLSTEWKQATDRFIELQKKWKEIGAVPRKKSEALWKRFRGACDEFFENRDKNGTPDPNDLYGNLKAKKRLVADILAYEPTEDETANADAMRAFNERWQSLGHVPFKEKDNINKAFRDAMQQKFPLFQRGDQKERSKGFKAQRSPKDLLVEKYRALQQDITTFENNIGFFSLSKNAEPLIQQMRERIEAAKTELKELENKIRKAEEEEQ
ncbi:MAG: DUF349 domain-containing protein [Bacteroidales bacterium]|nr:DUF349 domain-containing protein [Bacteroidales bacterium]